MFNQYIATTPDRLVMDLVKQSYLRSCLSSHLQALNTNNLDQGNGFTLCVKGSEVSCYVGLLWEGAVDA